MIGIDQYRFINPSFHLEYLFWLVMLLNQIPDVYMVPDKEDLDEINKIAHMLNPNEVFFVVARQSRLKPGWL